MAGSRFAGRDQAIHLFNGKWAQRPRNHIIHALTLKVEVLVEKLFIDQLSSEMNPLSTKLSTSQKLAQILIPSPFFYRQGRKYMIFKILNAERCKGALSNCRRIKRNFSLTFLKNKFSLSPKSVYIKIKYIEEITYLL